MTNFIRTAAVAGLVALGGASAFAQSDLRAKVPFAFATPGGGQMPAGSYEITRLNNTAAIPTYRILNVETKRSVVAMASDSASRPAGESNARPVVTFRCAGDNNCAISGVFQPGQRTGDGIRVPLKNVDPTTQIAEIMIPFGE